jgi:hypothetical protein
MVVEMTSSSASAIVLGNLAIVFGQYATQLGKHILITSPRWLNNQNRPRVAHALMARDELKLENGGDVM